MSRSNCGWRDPDVPGFATIVRAVFFLPLQLAALAFSVATLSAQSSDLADLERAAAARPADVQTQRRLAAAYETAGRRVDALTAWARVTELAPQLPGVTDLLDKVAEGIAVEGMESLTPALGKLPDRERRILQLRFYGNLTQSQIAAQLGISQMHVSRLLARTLARLREELQAEE